MIRKPNIWIIVSLYSSLEVHIVYNVLNSNEQDKTWYAVSEWTPQSQLSYSYLDSYSLIKLRKRYDN